MSLLDGILYAPVQRNRGIDAILSEGIQGRPVLVRIQRKDETLLDAANLLMNAARDKEASMIILVVTNKEGSLFEESVIPSEITVVGAPSLIIKGLVADKKSLKPA